MALVADISIDDKSIIAAIVGLVSCIAYLWKQAGRDREKFDRKALELNSNLIENVREVGDIKREVGELSGKVKTQEQVEAVIVNALLEVKGDSKKDGD